MSRGDRKSRVEVNLFFSYICIWGNARYVQRVNPGGDYVDYMMLSHYHADHAGCLSFYSRKVERDGEEFVLSGFSEAAETLRFGKAWLDDVAPASFEGGHVVVTVAKGGDEYSVAYLTADDESMTVRSSLDFRSGE